MRSKAALGIVLLVMTGACTIVTPPGADGGTRIVPVPIDPPPPPKPLEASVLFVVNLQRSSANLAGQYAQIMIGLGGYLESMGLQVQAMGVAPTYADKYGPRLVLGRRKASQSGPGPSLSALLAIAALADAGVTDYESLLPYIRDSLSNVSDTDLTVALQLLASSGSFEGEGETSEGRNVVELGRGLDTQALPPELGGIDRSALFDRPHDLFIVIYIQPLGRRCALDTPACQVNGRSLTDIFLEQNDQAGVTWLKFVQGNLRPEQVVHVAVATSEGEDLIAFRKRCQNVTGFRPNFLDVIAPSDNSYFRPLMSALNAAHRGTGNAGDFCELIGSEPGEAVSKLGNSVAAVLGSN